MAYDCEAQAKKNENGLDASRRANRQDGADRRVLEPGPHAPLGPTMPVTVDGARPKAWEQQVKSYVRKRYAHLAEGACVPRRRRGRERWRRAIPPDSSMDGPGAFRPLIAVAGICSMGSILKVCERPVELGCGAGLDARLVCERLDAGASLFALDFAPQMLHRAREACEGLGDGARLHLLAGDMENVPLADGVADIVLANASLNLTVDKAKALAEARRILKPGGRPRGA